VRSLRAKKALQLSKLADSVDCTIVTIERPSRIDFPPVLYIYVRSTRTQVRGLQSCCIEAIIVLGTLPEPPRLWSRLKFGEPQVPLSM
jgi:hypothetical protein